MLVDVGSGSVGLAISRQQKAQSQPEIIWSHREYILIKDTNAATHSLREINTSIINAFLHLGSDGLKVLRSSYPQAQIEHCQLTISAPWAYTISRFISYKQEQPFRVSKTLVNELTTAADQKALTAVLERAIVGKNGLRVIETKTIGIIANGYPFEQYEHIHTKTAAIELAHLTGITYQELMQTVTDSLTKILPHVMIFPHVFMYVFYDVMRDLMPQTNESCLIDVTSEATEMSILRDNLLRHTSHIAVGSYTLARRIATETGLPNEEAYAFIRGGHELIMEKLSKTKQAKLDAVLTAYEDELVALFQQTGDTLAIPKTIYLHADTDTETFFKNCLRRAAKRATATEHMVYTITSVFFATDHATSTDTTILLLANFAHKQLESGAEE